MKAVLLGALAAAALPMVVTIGLAAMVVPAVLSGEEHAWPAIYLAVLPLIVALPVVLVAALVIGLPTAAFLRWRGWESPEAYVLGGVVAGILIPLAAVVILRSPNVWWMVFLGAAGGGVAARVWADSPRAGRVPRRFAA